LCQSLTKRISSFESEQVILDSKSSTEQTKLGFEVLLRVLVVSFWGHTKKFAHFKKLIFSRTKKPDACTYLSEPDHMYRINCPGYWFCFFKVRLLNVRVYCRTDTDTTPFKNGVIDAITASFRLHLMFWMRPEKLRHLPRVLSTYHFSEPSWNSKFL